MVGRIITQLRDQKRLLRLQAVANERVLRGEHLPIDVGQNIWLVAVKKRFASATHHSAQVDRKEVGVTKPRGKFLNARPNGADRAGTTNTRQRLG